MNAIAVNQVVDATTSNLFLKRVCVSHRVFESILQQQGAHQNQQMMQDVRTLVLHYDSMVDFDKEEIEMAKDMQQLENAGQFLVRSTGNEVPEYEVNFLCGRENKVLFNNLNLRSSTVSRRQFQIVYDNFEGFKLVCTALRNPTGLVIENSPVRLFEGCLVHFSRCYRLLVEKIQVAGQLQSQVSELQLANQNNNGDQ